MRSTTHQTVLEHLDEVRRRLFIIALVFFVLAGTAYFFVEPILGYLTRDAGDLVYLAPAELFITQVKIAVAIALLAEMPLVLWQIIAFAFSGLERSTRATLIAFVTVATLLFYIGAAFAFFIVLPMTTKFFLSLQTPNILPMFSVESYISFVLLSVFGFGIVFLIPIPIILAIKLGMVTPSELSAARKYVLIIILILAAIVTPSPDAFTMTVLAVPLWLLFEISLGAGWLLHRGEQ